VKILITGHKGFIGQNMSKALAVHELSFYEWGDELPNVRDLDWVVHLGAISATTEKNVERVMSQNYEFSQWLLHECINAKVNFQYSSSASVYGLSDQFHEDSPKHPLSPYAWSKFLFDRYVERLENTNILIQGFRYFNVYGPHEDHKGNQASPYFQFEQQAITTGKIKLFEGSDKFLRDFVPVNIVCDVHRTFFDVRESGIWNVGTGRTLSFESVAQTIANKHGASIEYIPMPDNIKNQYQTYTCADTNKLKKHFSI